MKRILVTLLPALMLLTGCGVGSYSVSSGKADEGAISLTAAAKTPVILTIDGDTFNIEAVKDKAYKTDRKIKPTSRNTVFVTPGAHDVKVTATDGTVLLTKKVYISASEHKIIEL